MTIYQFAVIGAVGGVGLNVITFCASTISGRMSCKLHPGMVIGWGIVGGAMGLGLGCLWNL